MKRSFTEATKKKVAASQKWICSGCSDILDSTYQVDHTIPLWAGGADSPDNATAMCAGCHARKTQNEAIEKHARESRERIHARHVFEQKIWSEEEKKRSVKIRKDGSVTCMGCKKKYYPVFSHDCLEVRRKALVRMGKTSQLKGSLSTPMTSKRTFKKTMKLRPSMSIEQRLFQEYYFLGEH